MKGIILAGGHGSRLYPITQVVCKQLLPVFDKPMIYYPLSLLMFAGIKDILMISTPHDLPHFKELFGDGSKLGLKFSYKEQSKPNGLAEAFILGEEFIEKEDVCLVLGDNILYGHSLTELLKKAAKDVNTFGGATIFGYFVKDPERYGIVEFNDHGKALSLEEKPKTPRSNYAITGLYFYDNKVIDIAKNIKPSWRNELEITDVNREYLNKGNLRVEVLGRGYAWLDAGTHESLLEAAQFVETLERRQGLKISCIEEIAYSLGLINEKELSQLAQNLSKSQYGEYLLNLIKKK